MRTATFASLTALCFLFALSPSYAQQWEWQMPPFGANNIHRVVFTDTLTGWAVADSGTLLKTSDGGMTWTMRRHDPTYHLFGVSFPDPQHGWIAGGAAFSDWPSFGSMYRTNDGGETWTELTYTFESTVRDICFVDSLYGWMVLAYGGEAYKTTDGGDSWTVQTHLNEGWERILFADRQHGISYANYMCRHTSDGGTTWGGCYLPAYYDFAGIAYPDTNHAWLAGGNDILTSTNGGATWTVQYSGSWMQTLSFSNATNGWAVCGDRVLHTTDGGQSWAQQHGLGFPNLWSVAAFNERRACVVGDAGMVFQTSDGGTNWNHISGEYGVFLTKLSFVDGQNGWAIGDGYTGVENRNVVLHTRNGGITWTIQRERSDTTLSAVAFASPSEGAAVSTLQDVPGVYHGLVLRTENAGDTWAPVCEVPQGAMYDVAFTSADSGWAVGDSGVALRTIDGGIHWTRSTLGADYSLHVLRFVSSQIGWIVAYDAWGIRFALLHTTDAGENWNVQSTYPLNYDLCEVQFLNADTGWVGIGQADDPGTRLMFTTDGGESWTLRDSSNIERLNAFYFTDANNGWGARDGQLARTTDGGQSWEHQANNTNNWLEVVRFSGANSGWAAGYNGMILHYDGGMWSPSHGVAAMPTVHALRAYPNPFNPTTTLLLSVPVQGHVSLIVYDLLGRCVESVTDRVMPAGIHRITFDGSRLASGVYFARLQSAQGSKITKLMLLR